MFYKAPILITNCYSLRKREILMRDKAFGILSLILTKSILFTIIINFKQYFQKSFSLERNFAYTPFLVLF